MNKFIKVIIIMFFFFHSHTYIFQTEVAAESNTSTATVTVDKLNVRSEPSLASTVITQINKNEEYAVLDRKNEWVKLALNDGKKGWVANWLISIEKVQNTRNSTVESKVDALRVRSGPDTSFQVLGHIYPGFTYNLIEKKEEWAKISFNNDEGWVYTSFIETTHQTNITEEASTIDTTNETAVVHASILNVRSGPTLSDEIVGQLKEGEQLNIINVKDGWYEITFQGQSAWVAGEFVRKKDSVNSVDKQIEEEEEEEKETIKDSDETIEQQFKKVAIVNASILNVRSEASTDSQVIHKIKQGEKVVILEEDGDWRKIKTNDISGWVAGWLLDETNETTEGTTAEQPALVKGIVTATILNIRDNASLKGKVIGKLKKGESVKISKELDDWSEIQLPNQKKGWVASWYLEKQEENTQTITNPPTLSILNNGTNIRKGPSTSFQVVTRANEGDSFPILNKKGDWYEIELPNNKTAFVAGWIVSVSGNIPKVERKGIEQYFKGKTIVLDPGHGGKDSGAKGYRGTYEKVLTLRTAKLVANKLESAGANVILTRKNDLYASLHYRVSISHYYNADAFLSFHYDSAPVASANGIGTFYYSSKKDKPLASPIHKQLIKNTNMNDRKVRYGNYHVIRENKQPSILLELGFLSNRNDELTVGSNDYQEKTAQSIYTGLAQYFKKN